MLTGLIAAAALMGLLGSPHCVAMCGGCAAVGRTRRLRWAFLAGRLGGYAALGATTAASAATLRWAGAQVAFLAPLWALLHAALFAFGLSLIWLGSQPVWVDRAGSRLWQQVRIRTLGVDPARHALLAGALWALLPCGLLWSAAALAGLADTPLDGALVMTSFALASGVALGLGADLLQGARDRAPWAVRLAGLALAAGSAWALVQGVGDSPWCAVR